jgi:hypothetical protein
MTEDSVIAPADASIDEVEAGPTNSTDDVFPTEASVNSRKRFGRNSLSRGACPFFMTWGCPTTIRTWKSMVKLMMNEDQKSMRPKKNLAQKTGF